MKVALRPALPLLIGIALAAVLALVAMHSLSFGAAASTVGSHHSVEFATHGHAHAGTDLAGTAHHVQAGTATHDRVSAATHNHGASSVCTSAADTECCSSMANASSAPTITVHAFPGTTVSAVAASVPVASLLATEAAERPPARALLSVIRV